MENIDVIGKALKIYEEADDLAKDWLIKSWKLKDEDKIIAMAYYKKACKKRLEIARQLNNLIERKGVN